MEIPIPRLIIQGGLIKAKDCLTLMRKPHSNPKPRGKVNGFSRAARRRMLEQCAKMGKAVPIFATLTYGEKWPDDPDTWKIHLKNFLKRLYALKPDYAGLWRLEPQKRGAPHFHLLIYREKGRPFVDKDWVAKAWHEVRGEWSDADSLKAGTRIESLNSHRGAAFYCAKYCAKLPEDEVHDPRWDRAKKLWGIFNKKCLPEAKQHEMVLHSGMEQKAILFTMRDMFKKSFLSRAAAKHEKDGFIAPEALHMAVEDWKECRANSEHFGNTTTTYGSAEEFLSNYSTKIAELEIFLADHQNRDPNLRRVEGILDRCGSMV